MNKQVQNEYWEKLYKKQMKQKRPIPKDLKEKLAFYKIIYGEQYSRIIFKAGVPEYFEPNLHHPYGWLALYDDMTEKDIAFFFRQYKKARIQRLKNQKISIRKYLTLNTIRDYEWAKIAKKNKDKPDYKKIALDWAKKNAGQIRKMVLEYLWRNPSNSQSVELTELFQKGKKRKQKFVNFIVTNAAFLTKTPLKPDTEYYISFNLPRLIRSAVNRYSNKPH